MIAYLNIHPYNFVYNGTDSEDDVAEKLLSLVSDMRDIYYNHSEENKFKCHEEILSCPIFQQINIIDFAVEHLQNDEQALFFSVFCNTSNSFNCSIEELCNICCYKEDEEVVNSMLVLNSSSYKPSPVSPSQFDKYEVIFNRQSWISLRRQILGNHPGCPKGFIAECCIYFPNLFFHDNCVSSLSEDNYLACIPRKIVYYLSALNDSFKMIREKHKDRENDANSILEDFSGHCCLDEAGSLQGDPKTKYLRKFVFGYNDNNVKKQIEMECEPHLKIESHDKNYSGRISAPFHPRIYFHFGQQYVEGGKILIGSIGPHL